MNTLFLIALAMLAVSADDPVIPLERAHSHNDYVRKQPLTEALALGFCSVEADTFLVDGDLLVAHDLKDVRPERSLRGMYLEPLRQRVRANGGRVYPNGPAFTLLIDIKDDGAANYARLREMLEEYEEMLTVFTADSTEERAVTVIISGSRPKEILAAEPRRRAALDGRLEDIGANRHLYPLVSESWNSVFTWRGRGPMPEEERSKLAGLAERVHASGQRLRFWALPWGKSDVYPTLYALGVDLLNADNLPELRDFLLSVREAGN